MYCAVHTFAEGDVPAMVAELEVDPLVEVDADDVAVVVFSVLVVAPVDVAGGAGVRAAGVDPALVVGAGAVDSPMAGPDANPTASSGRSTTNPCCKTTVSNKVAPTIALTVVGAFRMRNLRIPQPDPAHKGVGARQIVSLSGAIQGTDTPWRTVLSCDSSKARRGSPAPRETPSTALIPP